MSDDTDDGIMILRESDHAGLLEAKFRCVPICDIVERLSQRLFEMESERDRQLSELRAWAAERGYAMPVDVAGE